MLFFPHYFTTELNNLILSKKIDAAIEFLKQNVEQHGETCQNTIKENNTFLHNLATLVVDDALMQELWSLWDMESKLYNSHIQWLPKEILEDTTNLFHPLFYSYCHLFELLLKHGADINMQDKGKKTPLHLAIACHNELMARLLLGSGAKVSVQNNQGETVLHDVARGNNESMMSLLLLHSNRADINLQHNSLEETALYWAVCHGNESMAQLLLQY